MCNVKLKNSELIQEELNNLTKGLTKLQNYYLPLVHTCNTRQKSLKYPCNLLSLYNVEM